MRGCGWSVCRWLRGVAGVVCEAVAVRPRTERSHVPSPYAIVYASSARASVREAPRGPRTASRNPLRSTADRPPRGPATRSPYTPVHFGATSRHPCARGARAAEWERSSRQPSEVAGARRRRVLAHDQDMATGPDRQRAPGREPDGAAAAGRRVRRDRRRPVPAGVRGTPGGRPRRAAPLRPPQGQTVGLPGGHGQAGGGRRACLRAARPRLPACQPGNPRQHRPVMSRVSPPCRS